LGSSVHSDALNVGSMSSAEDLRSLLDKGDGVMEKSPSRNVGDLTTKSNFLLGDSRNRLDSLANMSATVYRIGTVGYDTQLCLWDISDEQLQASPAMVTSIPSNFTGTGFSNHFGSPTGNNSIADYVDSSREPMAKESKTSKLKKLHKRGLSFGNRHSNHTDRIVRGTQLTNTSPSNEAEPEDLIVRLFGTPQCPRMDAVPLIEPLLCKKISHERLTVICFREDCLVTACQEGYVATWARPNRMSRL